MPITLQDAIDAGTLTLNNFKRDEFAYVLKHNDYPFLNKLYGGSVPTQTGKMITRDVVVGTTGNARHTKLMQKVQRNIRNITKEIAVPWRHADTSFSYIVQEVAIQGGSSGFVSLLDVRRTNMYAEFADVIEERAWKTPDDSTDETSPHGIPYWLPVCAANEEGFHDGNPFYMNGTEITTGAGGLSTATYTKWRPYAADYTAVNGTLLKQWSRAFRKTKFRSPAIVPKSAGENDSESSFSLYTNDAVLADLEDFALKADDRVGADLGKYAGAVVFKRIPVEYCDVLDDADGSTLSAAVYGTNPIYGINWKQMEPVILEGDKFREDPPRAVDPDLPNVISVYLNLSYNYVCPDRSKLGFVLSQI